MSPPLVECDRSDTTHHDLSNINNNNVSPQQYVNSTTTTLSSSSSHHHQYRSLNHSDSHSSHSLSQPLTHSLPRSRTTNTHTPHRMDLNGVHPLPLTPAVEERGTEADRVTDRQSVIPPNRRSIDEHLEGGESLSSRHHSSTSFRGGGEKGESNTTLSSHNTITSRTILPPRDAPLSTHPYLSQRFSSATGTAQCDTPPHHIVEADNVLTSTSECDDDHNLGDLAGVMYMPCEPFTVRIPRSEVFTTTFSKHTEYVIEVEECHQSIFVTRRYSQFVKLHCQLSSAGISVLPMLPPRRLIRNMDPEFVERRRQDLEVYLQCLLKDEEVKNEDAIWQFVKADDATIIASRFLSRALTSSLSSSTRPSINSLRTTPIVLEESIAQLHRVASDPHDAHRLLNTQILDALLSMHQVPNFKIHTYTCLILHELLKHDVGRGTCEVHRYMVEHGALACVLSMLQSLYPTGGNLPLETSTVSLLDAARDFCFYFLEICPSALLAYFRNHNGLLQLRNMLNTYFFAELHSFLAMLIWMSMGLSEMREAFANTDSLGMEMLSGLYQSRNVNAKFSCGLMISYMLSTGYFKDELADRAAFTLERLPFEIQQLCCTFTHAHKSPCDTLSNSMLPDSARTVPVGNEAERTFTSGTDTSRDEHDVPGLLEPHKARTASFGDEDLGSPLFPPSSSKRLPPWYKELDYYFVSTMVTYGDSLARVSSSMLSPVNPNTEKYPQITFYLCWTLSILVTQPQLKRFDVGRGAVYNEALFSHSTQSTHLIPYKQGPLYVPLTPEARTSSPETMPAVDSLRPKLLPATTREDTVSNLDYASSDTHNTEDLTSVSSANLPLTSPLTGAMDLSGRAVTDIGQGLNCFTSTNIDINPQTSFLILCCKESASIARLLSPVIPALEEISQRGASDTIRTLASITLLHIPWSEAGRPMLQNEHSSGAKSSQVEQFTATDLICERRLKQFEVLLKHVVAMTESQRDLLRCENERLCSQESSVERRRIRLAIQGDHLEAFRDMLHEYEEKCSDLFVWCCESRSFLSLLRSLGDSLVMVRSNAASMVESCNNDLGNVKGETRRTIEGYQELSIKENELRDLKQTANEHLRGMIDSIGTHRRTAELLKNAKKKAAASRNAWMEVEALITNAPQRRRRLAEKVDEFTDVLNGLKEREKKLQSEAKTATGNDDEATRDGDSGTGQAALANLERVARQLEDDIGDCTEKIPQNLRAVLAQLEHLEGIVPQNCKKEVNSILDRDKTPEDALTVSKILELIDELRQVILQDLQRTARCENELINLQNRIRERELELEKLNRQYQAELDTTPLVQRAASLQLQVREDDTNVEQLSEECGRLESESKSFEQKLDRTKEAIRSSETLVSSVTKEVDAYAQDSAAHRQKLCECIVGEETKLRNLLYETQSLREDCGYLPDNRNQLSRRLQKEKRGRESLRHNLATMIQLLQLMDAQLEKIDEPDAGSPKPAARSLLGGTTREKLSNVHDNSNVTIPDDRSSSQDSSKI